jgi:glycosyltransferase involved in cell wall biosynthesis
VALPPLRILYSAIDQVVPGTLGGSVHVQAVAEGLAALGHEVHVLTGRGGSGWPRGKVRWHDVEAPAGRPQFRLLASRTVARIARAVEPQILLERYHNFGGEGLLAARRGGAHYVLEVNAPVVDYPGSPKSKIDRALLVQPMRRWRDRQVRAAALVISPSRLILPDWVKDDQVLEIEWGADTSRFRPGAATSRWSPEGAISCVFAGAFRAWHGAIALVEALRVLQARGVTDVNGVLIGDGPERPAVQEAARGLAGITFTGALPHDRMPAALAAADIGVAPFDVARHPPLQLAFYWSPLKIFEYMASGLPVVAPALPRLQRLVAHGEEGLLYDPPTPDALADAIAALRDPDVRLRLGQAARRRAEAEYSWRAHCLQLERAFHALVAHTRNS